MNRFTVKIIQKVFKFSSTVAPGICALLAFQQWFKTQRHSPPKREIAWTSSATQKKLPTSFGELNLLTWPGTGPRVLLVHGWSGRASQMGSFAKPLTDLGFEVIAVDLPGHGASYGNTSSLPESAQAICDIEKFIGPIHTLIGHSFGGAVCLLAHSEGVKIQALVTISAPSKLEWLLALYVDFLNLSDKAKRKLITLLENKYGKNIWTRCDVEKTKLDLKSSGLIIHDYDDKDVPIQHAEVIANATSARLLKTSRLGHRRILRNKDVINEIATFIRSRQNS